MPITPPPASSTPTSSPYTLPPERPGLPPLVFPSYVVFRHTRQFYHQLLRITNLNPEIKLPQSWTGDIRRGPFTSFGFFNMLREVGVPTSSWCYLHLFNPALLSYTPTNCEWRVGPRVVNVDYLPPAHMFGQLLDYFSSFAGTFRLPPDRRRNTSMFAETLIHRPEGHFVGRPRGVTNTIRSTTWAPSTQPTHARELPKLYGPDGTPLD